MINSDPGDPVPPDSTGADVRFWVSRIGEVIL